MCLKWKLTFLGDVISEDGLKPDPVKVKAILEFEKPKSKKELKRILAMVNKQGRYIQNWLDKPYLWEFCLRIKMNLCGLINKTTASKNWKKCFQQNQFWSFMIQIRTLKYHRTVQRLAWVQYSCKSTAMNGCQRHTHQDR